MNVEPLLAGSRDKLIAAMELLFASVDDYTAFDPHRDYTPKERSDGHSGERQWNYYLQCLSRSIGRRLSYLLRAANKPLTLMTFNAHPTAIIDDGAQRGLIMEIEAICENGVVRLPKNLRFNHDRFTVTVNVPDRELLSDPLPSTTTPARKNSKRLGARERLNAILGPYRGNQEKGTFTTKDYKAMWREHLEEKYLAR